MNKKNCSPFLNYKNKTVTTLIFKEKKDKKKITGLYGIQNKGIINYKINHLKKIKYILKRTSLFFKTTTKKTKKTRLHVLSYYFLPQRNI